MDRAAMFCMYFASIAAMRFHPRNVCPRDVSCLGVDAGVAAEISFARDVAMVMVMGTEEVFSKRPPEVQ